MSQRQKSLDRKVFRYSPENSESAPSTSLNVYQTRYLPSSPQDSLFLIKFSNPLLRLEFGFCRVLTIVRVRKLYLLTYFLSTFSHAGPATWNAFSALTLLVGRQEGHPSCKKTEWWGAGVVICLELGADLHVAQLMPLPLTVAYLASVKSRLVLPFWYRLTG